MTPQQARYFARKLYRLARRVEQRKVGEWTPWAICWTKWTASAAS